MIVLAALGSLSGAPPRQLPSPPPMGVVPKTPDWRTQQTTYRCGNEVARFTLRFDADSRARFSAAERGGRSLSGADLKKVGQALARLDSLHAIVPECAGTTHILSATGMVGAAPATVTIVWMPRTINVSAPTVQGRK